MRDATVDTADGRTLAYTVIGADDGICLFFFHGAPTTRLRLGDMDEVFASHGVRVISPDRPSYGGSSPHPGRTMADWPNDVLTVADEIGVERFLVAGHSSGGPYAVACCALVQGRVDGGIVLGGITDMGWDEAWTGYLPAETEIMRLPDEGAAIDWCAEKFGEDGSGFFDATPFELPAPDEAMFANERPDTARKAAAMEAFRQGVVGYAQDIYVQGRPWTFDPAVISVPVVVVHGEQDTLVPIAHSRHTAEVIPTATLRVLPGHGHFTTLAELPATAAELAAGNA